MGFSGKTASCGYAFKQAGSANTVSRNMKFHECLQAVSNRIAEHRELVLIVEAPLSSAFSEEGNPQPRGEFERSPKPRWWSLGPGAAMSLAAMYFLKGIVQKVSEDCCCHLIEGFVVGADSGHDADVAEALIKSFFKEHDCSWQESQGRLVSVIDWVEPQASAAPGPIVLIPVFA